jgi:hypothetical protein
LRRPNLPPRATSRQPAGGRSKHLGKRDASEHRPNDLAREPRVRDGAGEHDRRRAAEGRPRVSTIPLL